MGWTKEKYTKLGNNVSESHARLMGLLQAYNSDMETAVEYFFEENKHPLEDTYWKSRVCISVWDEAKRAFRVYSVYNHRVSHATMKESMDDAAFEAYMGLHARRFWDMMEDQFQFLPCYQHELGWAMMKPLDPTTVVMVNFAHELMKRNERLEEELKAQKEAHKRSQKMVDDYRESLKMSRMYEKLPRDPLP